MCRPAAKSSPSFSPRDDKLLIKRIIGVPGDVVRMRNNQIYVNNEPATYTALDEKLVRELDIYQRRHHHFFYEKIDESTWPVMLRPALPDRVPTALVQSRFPQTNT
ncbi:MAG: S26 family signal peptidase [Gammaproteobacteria bacterium]|nr:S26 family signal peptidase [Gammaproteobacteria bacterium]